MEGLYKYRQRPIAFARDVLGITSLDDWQKKVLVALCKTQKVAVAGCTGCGKDYVAAIAILWFLAVHERPKVICTAVKEDTLRDNLWSEIHKILRNAPVLQSVFTFGSEKIALKGEEAEWFAVARTTTKRYGKHGEGAQSEGLAGKYADDVLYVIDEACHSADTEVLTDQGWMLFSEVPKQEVRPKILTMNPETSVAYYSDYSSFIELPFVGQIYEYTRRGGNFAVTSNHEMVYRVPQPWKDEGKSELRVSPLSRIKSNKIYIPRTFKWHGTDEEWFILPPSRNGESPRSLKMNDWLEFLGWYCSEGSLARHKGNGRTYVSTITQVKSENHDRISDVLTRLNLSWRLHSKRDFRIYDVQIGEYLRTLGNSCLERKLPSFIGTLSPSQIRIFLDAYLLGDGYLHAKRKIIYTSSAQIADELQILICKTGSYATIQRRRIAGQVKWINDHYATTSVDGWVVAESSRPEADLSVRPKSIEQVNYVGNVYCLSLPADHLLYTRRNGVCMWSHNSGVDDANYDALEGSANTPRRKMLVIGNPLRRSGRFAQIFLDPTFGRGWYTDNVSYLKSSMLSTPDQKLIRERWIEMYGINSAYVQARAFGNFPTSASIDTIFYRDEIQEAMQRNDKLKDNKTFPLCIGIDCSRFGLDETVLYARRGLKSLKMVPIAKTTGPEICRAAIALAIEFTPHNMNPRDVTQFRIDETGVGGSGVIDPLREDNWTVCAIDNGRRASRPDDYNVLGSELWMEDMKAAIHDCGLIPDEILMNQLETRRYLFTGKAKQRRLATKEEMKKEGIGSPDRADACVLAFANSDKLEIGPLDWRTTIMFL